MSTALAIAGVTAVLRDLLNDRLINHDLSATMGTTVAVSSLPPSDSSDPNARETKIHVLLRSVTHNAAWRNEQLPSRDASGKARLSNPPLALDLHYVVAAVGAEELHAEILLGHAMQLLHETPVLNRRAIRDSLASPTGINNLPPALRALDQCGLADQVEQIRISPSTMSSEEMSQFWSALKVQYRPMAAYDVSVVLIQSVLPTSSPLPVLSRGIQVLPGLLPPYPAIEKVSGFAERPGARLDDTVSLEGINLSGTGREVVLENDRLDIRQTLSALAASTSALLQFTIPAARSADFPAGIYRVVGRVVPPTETLARETNSLAFMVLPRLTSLPGPPVARDAQGTATLSVNFTPHVRVGQTVSLLFGRREIQPQPFVAPTNTLTFKVTDAPAGKQPVRLRIDGIDSPIVNPNTPPAFSDAQVEIT